jgi:hypothetical protein
VECPDIKGCHWASARQAPGLDHSGRTLLGKRQRYPDKLPRLLLRWERGARGQRGLVVYAVPQPEGQVQRGLGDAGLSPC